MSYIWVHEDAMRLDHPVFQAAGGSAQPVFIWDTQEHDKRGYSFKRRVFIYESAQALNIPIYAGEPHEVLSALSDGSVLYAADTPDPYIQQILAELGRYQDVVKIGTEDLSHIPANADMGRFFRFWNKAKKSALTASWEKDETGHIIRTERHRS